jgi:hypothetical protein
MRLNFYIIFTFFIAAEILCPPFDNAQELAHRLGRRFHSEFSLAQAAAIIPAIPARVNVKEFSSRTTQEIASRQKWN